MTKTVCCKMPHSLLARIDGLASNRSDFIREAVEEKVKRVGVKGRSAWAALEKARGLNLRVPVVKGRVKRIKL